MNTSIHRSTMTATVEPAEKLEVQVTQLWGDNVIAQKHASEGALAFTVAEDEIEIVRWMSGELLVTPPGGQAFALRAGHSVDVVHRDMIFRVSVSVREERPRRNVAAAMLEDSTLRTVIGSGVLHAALLAAFAFFMPAMSQADDDVLDRQRIIDLKAYIQSAAEREQDRKPEESQGADSPSGGESGMRAKNEEGKSGGLKQTHEGHWTAKGTERPENAQLARDRALREAAEFGMAGLLATQASDPDAPVVPWGHVLAGADAESHSGSLYGADPGDVFGGGLGLTGAGEGGGGPGEGIGLNNIGGLGGTCDEHCMGNHGGFGHGHGQPRGSHTAGAMPIHFTSGEVTTNGRLDPAVIQRIVRLNQGRFVGCYQQGLQGNPSLEGRVAVRFVIGREGNVDVAQDTGGSDMPDMNVRSCVVKAFYGLSFPQPAGGIVSVNYPLTFTPAQ